MEHKILWILAVLCCVVPKANSQVTGGDTDAPASPDAVGEDKNIEPPLAFVNFLPDDTEAVTTVVETAVTDKVTEVITYTVTQVVLGISDVATPNAVARSVTTKSIDVTTISDDALQSSLATTVDGVVTTDSGLDATPDSEKQTNGEQPAMTTKMQQDDVETTEAVTTVKETTMATEEPTTQVPEMETTAAGTGVGDISIPDEAETTIVAAIENGTTGIESETKNTKSGTTVQIDDAKETVTVQHMSSVTTEVPSNDPCDTSKVLTSPWRHINRRAANVKRDDMSLVGRWVSFKHDEQWAVIPQVPIKDNHCGSKVPYRVDLDGESLPEVGQIINTTLCTVMSIGNYYEPCTAKTTISIKRCQDHYVYNVWRLLVKGTICVTREGEAAPNKVLVYPDKDYVPPEVVATTQAPLLDNVVDPANLTEEQSEGLVTVILSYSHKQVDPESFLIFEDEFRKRLLATLELLYSMTTVEATKTDEVVVVTRVYDDNAQEEIVDKVTEQGVKVTKAGGSSGADDAANSINKEAVTLMDTEFRATIVNEAGAEDIPPNPADAEEPNDGLRRRRAAENVDVTVKTDEVEPEKVMYVLPTPVVKDGDLQMTLFVEDEDGNVIPAEDVLRALALMAEEDKASPAVKEIVIIDKYRGLPKESRPVAISRASVWEAHKGLWIVVIVMLALVILIALLCLICLLCCRKDEYSPAEKSPLREAEEATRHGGENPVFEDVMVRDEAPPMVEAANPAYSRNGGGGHLVKDEDNGYIVPLYELKVEERFTIQENTKL